MSTFCLQIAKRHIWKYKIEQSQRSKGGWWTSVGCEFEGSSYVYLDDKGKSDNHNKNNTKYSTTTLRPTLKKLLSKGMCLEFCLNQDIYVILNQNLSSTMRSSLDNKEVQQFCSCWTLRVSSSFFYNHHLTELFIQKRKDLYRSYLFQEL